MNKLFIRSFLLILLFFTFASYAALAVTLEGTALDPSGKAVPGARVSLLHSLVAIAECKTDARGYYKFDGLQDGVYQLSASAQGLSSQSIEVSLLQSEAKKQDIKLEITALAMQVVVSASLGGALAPQIGSSVDVVMQQEMEDRNAQNALEIVRGVSGVEVNQTGRRGGFTQLFIRGGDYSYNAVMMDGIPMNEFGGRFDMSSLPVDGVERIEVARGPQSALYGSNAVAGVINLISRRGNGSPTFTALAEGGSYSTRRFATGGSGLNGGFSWSYNLSRLDTDGVVQNDFYRNQSAFLSLGYHQSRRQLDFHFFGNANHSGDPGPYGSDPNDFVDPAYKINTKSYTKQNLFGYQFGYNEQFSNRIRQVTTVSTATNDLFYHTHSHDLMWGDSDSDYTSTNLRVVVNTRSEISLSANNTLSAGFEFNHEATDQATIAGFYKDKYQPSRNSYAYFVEDRWDIRNRLFLTAGARIDDLRTDALRAIPSSSLTKINPRVSLAYLVQKGSVDGAWGSTRMHGSFGTGIRPPSGYELSRTDNPLLKPEKSISFDAGVEQKLFSSRSILDFTYFFNRFEDQIIGLAGSSLRGLSKYSYANLKNSRAQGLEISYRVHPIRSLELGGAYTFLDSSVLALDGSDKTTAPYRVGQELLRRPRHSASYNVTWRYGRLMLNTNAYIRGAVLDVDPTQGTYACTGYGLPCFFTNEGYTRADAGFSFRIARGVEIYGRVNNLLNRKYEESFGFPAYRANYVGGMRFSFSPE
jgi:outer membrane receptor protein involved in Fe transport